MEVYRPPSTVYRKTLVLGTYGWHARNLAGDSETEGRETECRAAGDADGRR